MSTDSPPEPSGSQFKVAIPRLARPKQRPPFTRMKRGDRVQRACRNCHTRKIKCSGDVPICESCEKTNRKCVYEHARKDRLADATHRNEHLVALLKDLSLRVGHEDRKRIQLALNESEDEAQIPMPISFTTHFEGQAPISSHQNRPHASTSSSLSSGNTNFRIPLGTTSTSDASLPLESNNSEYDIEYARGSIRSGSVGQISDIQWLRSLQRRLWVAGRTDSLSNAAKNIPSNYFLDDEGIDISFFSNPYELPHEDIARVLFQCCLRTVHTSFPILPTNLENQLHIYYELARNGQSAVYPPKWFALVNMVLAIGALFSHLIDAKWQADGCDHMAYMSRAFQLLELHNTSIILAAPDLPMIQATGLIAFYYLALGHPNRSWLMCGTALRLALAFGLHAQGTDKAIGASRRQSMLQTWWSLRSLEPLLSSITGRPCVINSEEITTPQPNESSLQLYVGGTWSLRNMSFLDANVGIGDLTQLVLSTLYTHRRTSQSWNQTQNTQRSLMGKLDGWALVAAPRKEFGTRELSLEERREWLLLRFHYYRTLILITRPSLSGVEQSVEAGSLNITSFDQSTAELCIQAAQEFTTLLATEGDVQSSYERRPWWTIVHNIMQALVVLMDGISCPQRFGSSAVSSALSVKALAGWLRAMRGTNPNARKAYEIVYNVVKASPQVWTTIADAFPDETFAAGRLSDSQKEDPWYLGWAEQENSVHPMYGFQLNESGNYDIYKL